MRCSAGIARSVLVTLVLILVTSTADGRGLRLTFCCAPGNDLYRALVRSGYRCPRYDTAAQATDRAAPGTALLLLDGDVTAPTQIRTKDLTSILDAARAKDLRVYLEYPASLPGVETGPARVVDWERVVVTTDSLGPDLPRLEILSIHRAPFLPITTLPDGAVGLLTLARVAGFHHAVYGLPQQGWLLLFAVPERKLWVGTAVLSGFVRGRYAPGRLWGRLWEQILARLDPGADPVSLKWTPVAHPAYGPKSRLPGDVERRALAAGARWYRDSQLLVSAARSPEIHRLLASGAETSSIPPADAPAGDGSMGILEGYASGIAPDGSQQQRVPLRADCNAESAMALAVAESALGDHSDGPIARNLLDYVYFHSGMQGGARGDPGNPAYGLVGWGAIAPAWEVANYGDDNARVLLATMAAGACLHSDRWDEALLKGVLANFRTTGVTGFRGDRIDMPDLERRGWQAYFRGSPVNPSPHFESYLWACYLRAYGWTGYAPFLERTEVGIRKMMEVYPGGWRLSPSIERARMLLCLAWLVRIKDSPEAREWLHRVAADLLASQEPGGAIRETLSRAPGGGYFGAVASNEAYGTGETPLIQDDGDTASDQLYTTGFALLGLHEAAAATGDSYYRKAEDRLARFLCRIQIRSPKDPWLDGAWFRAFDTGNWEYWASSADTGWGAWCVESGWSQAWTLAVLGLRLKRTNLWELTARRPETGQFERLKAEMLPGGG